MRTRLAILVVAIAVSASIGAPNPAAQVVRESDASSIAGLLGGGAPSTMYWTFKSQGGEILFASLDGDVYATAGDHHDDVLAAEEGEGCEDDRPARFCLQVLDAYDAVLCESTRPAPPPGWQRDPRLACVIPSSRSQATYSVRVSLASPEGECLTNPLAFVPADAHPFLLDLSLRGVAPGGVHVQEAVAKSRNQF